MDDADLYANLPADPEQAFLALEKAFRADVEDSIVQAGEQEDITPQFVAYMSRVLAAVAELGLETNFHPEIPLVQNVGFQNYVNFTQEVRHYCTRLEIRNARRVQGHSVRFDSAARQKIHHFLTQVRELVEKLEIGDKRRDRLFTKISALELEVDRARTRLEAFGELVIEAASDIGEAAEKLSPVRKILDSIAKVIHGTKEENEVEDQKRLPAPKEQKRIEHQTKPDAKSGGGFSREMDDEIPF
jgi:hypothetical protein